jgi:hypothetical protein
MPRLQTIPEQLKHGPITIAFAAGFGFSRQQLRGRNWRPIARGVYVWAGLEPDWLSELAALHNRLPRRCVFSGPTAARLHGLEADGGKPVVLTVPPGVSLRARAGLSIHRAALDPADVTTCGSLPVTTPLRTCFDLSRCLPLVEAVAVVDQALNRKLITVSEFRRHVGGSPGLRGVRHARRVMELVEPAAESPMESRLRLILVLGGLPRPQVQTKLRDASGNFLARPDLFYPEARLAIEYDGTTHRDSLVADDRRQNRLQKAGYRLLRYTGPDVYYRPEEIVDEVRTQLALAGRG